jgi:hypothetical protein
LIAGRRIKLDIPDEYLLLQVSASEHYHAHIRAFQREDARHQEAADWFKQALSGVCVPAGLTVFIAQPPGPR